MSTHERQTKHLILILSSDAVAAALVGALVETLGYSVRFHQPPEDPTETIRRARPDVAMLDGDDQLMISDEVLGHAAMRGISVVVFGSREALDGIRALARTHRIHTLIAPPSLQDTSNLLSQVLAERR
jgi:DNA-binding NtrC family response regulator